MLKGSDIDSNPNGSTVEFQLPPGWFTLIGKFYNGSDWQTSFGGKLFSTYNDTAGLTSTVVAASIDDASSMILRTIAVLNAGGQLRRFVSAFPRNSLG